VKGEAWQNCEVLQQTLFHCQLAHTKAQTPLKLCQILRTSCCKLMLATQYNKIIRLSCTIIISFWNIVCIFQTSGTEFHHVSAWSEVCKLISKILRTCSCSKNSQHLLFALDWGWTGKTHLSYHHGMVQGTLHYCYCILLTRCLGWPKLCTAARQTCDRDIQVSEICNGKWTQYSTLTHNQGSQNYVFFRKLTILLDYIVRLDSFKPWVARMCTYIIL
jgi:hypothetical protein